MRNTRQRANGAAEGVENEWMLQTLAFTKQFHKQHGGEQGSETKKNLSWEAATDGPGIFVLHFQETLASFSFS